MMRYRASKLDCDGCSLKPVLPHAYFNSRGGPALFQSGPSRTAVAIRGHLFVADAIGQFIRERYLGPDELSS